ncbi:putative RNA-directed DNA polymerase from transposon BS [Araneus ventricosus]|uniref:Putative RNA-directed DNA polymerase from transposon BS n=1 Tax=Araneus ventricosus TaxID=182803 RepID=A0A4Y2E0H3_ARAVE|nr:putative RNA-directed DNA polymerase from transposon BS [Araneus ventricosus]
MSMVFVQKLLIFFSSIASEEFDVICLTETCLCEQIDSPDLSDDRYLVSRKDRDSSTSSCKRGGDVMVAIKKNASASQILVPLIDLECIWISVKLNFGKKLLLCVLYVPPASGIEQGCAEFLVYTLLALFNLSLKTNAFLHVWKWTKIVPVSGKGNAEECKNYRPIEILSPLSKIFEIIIHKKLISQVKNVISTAQHGFPTKRSTSTNLLCLTEKVISAFEDNCQLDVIYTDFSKAFDLIDFRILMKELRTIGCHFNLAQWLFSYLSNRILYDYFNKVVSDAFSNTSGVPRSSNLGPLLFILFINDHCGELGFSGCHLFADDLKFFRQIRSSADAALLQNGLDNLYQWCIVNKLLLEKCSILSFTRKSQPIFYSYQINGILLRRSKSVTELGVTFDARFYPTY